MLQVKSAQQLEQEQTQSQEEMVANNRPPNMDNVINGLTGHVRAQFEIAKTHKLHVQDRLLNCLRRRKGEYSPSKLQEITETGGATIYMKIAAAKCVGAKAWLSDLFNAQGDKPFSLEPTPIEELPPEIHEKLVHAAMQGAMQLGVPEEEAYELMKKHEKRLKQEMKDEAELRMEKMEDYIEDVLVEGNFRKVFDDFLNDFVTFPTAILSGINFKNKKKVKWVDLNGEFVPKEEMTISKEFNRVSPFDAYPSPTIKNGEPIFMCEHVRFSPTELADMRDLAGYKAEAIFQVLMDHRSQGLRQWMFNDSDREQLEGGGTTSSTSYSLIDGIKYNGSVQGSMLMQWGMTKEMKLDPVAEYMVSVIVIGSQTIRALINPDPAGRLNYYSACWRPIPNSFWGEALVETIADIEDMANATARSLANNMALGASPMVTMDIAQLPNGEIPTIKPFGLYLYDSSKGMTNSNRAGISHFQFEIRSAELLNVYERFVRYADEISGIPSYAFGSDSGAGAAKTASGLSMLMNAAGKNMKSAVREIDINVIEKLIEHVFNIIMLDPETPKEIKGDAKVKARGSDSLMHKESSAMRQQELLAMTNNPTDLQITGLDGRREMFKAVLKSSDLPYDKIIMDEEKMQQEQMRMQQEQMMMQQQGQSNGQQ
jgi:hypothetical protein